MRARGVLTFCRTISRRTQGVQTVLLRSELTSVRRSLYVQPDSRTTTHKRTSYTEQHVNRCINWSNAVRMHCVYTISILRLDDDKNQK